MHPRRNTRGRETVSAPEEMNAVAVRLWRIPRSKREEENEKDIQFGRGEGSYPGYR